MKKKAIGFIGVFLLIMIIGLVFVSRKNKVSTQEAKQASVKVTNKIESTYSNFNAYIDSAEQVKREMNTTNRILVRTIIYKDQKIEEIESKNEYLEKENRYLKNEAKALRDSIRAYDRVRYRSE